MEINNGLMTFNPRSAVKPIIQILHDKGIPIAGISQVFELVMEDAISHTVPYDVQKFNDELKKAQKIKNAHSL